MQVNIFSQTKESRILVGRLWKENEYYCFQYNPAYLKQKTSIPLGPELPKYKTGIFRSKEFFPSFFERVPSRQNPEYVNYARQWNISPEEKDPLVLISTIGNRGPSSFIFRKAEDFLVTGMQIKEFREKLGLSLREFAVFIDIDHATLLKTEKGLFSSKLILRLCTILINVPQALEYQLQIRGQFLHDNKIQQIKNYLKTIHE